MPTSVKWVEYHEGKKPIDKKWDCFATLGKNGGSYERKLPDSVDYLCKIDKKLNKNEIKFYIDFLNKILDTSLFECKMGENEDIIIFKQKTKEISWHKLLLHLTAQRYLDEYPEIIKQFYNYGVNFVDVNELFILFQYLHWAFDRTRFFKNKKYGNLSGHGLITYYFKQDFEPIFLEDFKNNLNKDTSRNVQSFFNINNYKLGEKYEFLEEIQKDVDKAKLKY